MASAGANFTRFTKAQKNVLNLYRSFLRAAKTKPLETQAHFKAVVRQGFEANRNIPVKEFARIEFLVRQGQKQLKMMESPHMTSIENIHVRK